MNKKPWLSKTIWLNFVGGIAGSIALFWAPAGAVAKFLTDNAAVIAIVWSGLGLGLRLVTKDKVSLLD